MADCSINSSIQKSADEEESGWTAYFEDFLNDKDHSYCSSVGCSSSLISDAATPSDAWKISHNNSHNKNFASPMKIRFKKTRTKAIFYEDDSLEDTASSPVNSPKVCDLKSNDMNTRRREDQIHSSLGKEAGSENYSKRQIEEERKMISFDPHDKKMKNNNDCTELSKRGLSLVPLSMLVNYLA